MAKTRKPTETPTAAPRVAAATLRPGDRVTVFAHPAGKFGTGQGRDYDGTVAHLAGAALPMTIDPGIRITFTDGTVVDAVYRAVSTLHQRGPAPVQPAEPTFTALTDAEGPDAAEEVTFPSPAAWVTVTEPYTTRHIGTETGYDVIAGTVLYVVDNWIECCDTHVQTPDGAEVWVCPLDLYLVTDGDPTPLNPEHVTKRKAEREAEHASA